MSSWLFTTVRALCSKLLQSCLTLCNPISCSQAASSVHGILQARILKWVIMPSCRGSSWLRNQMHVLYVSCIGGGFFTTSITWESPFTTAPYCKISLPFLIFPPPINDVLFFFCFLSCVRLLTDWISSCSPCVICSDPSDIASLSSPEFPLPCAFWPDSACPLSLVHSCHTENFLHLCFWQWLPCFTVLKSSS